MYQTSVSTRLQHYLQSKKKFSKKKKHLNISFLNIPAETPDEPLTEYLSEYADIVGTPLHIRKDHDGIPYYTGTRVYQVNRLYQHLPRQIKEMFGRTVLCIYDNQPTNLDKGTIQIDRTTTDRG